MFAEISAKYPKHFELKNSRGETVTIDSSSVVGRFLIDKLSMPTKAGWIEIKQEEPSSEGDAFGALAQLNFRTDHEIVEIRLSKRIEADEVTAERFWTSLSYELGNASQSAEFLELRRALQEKEITSPEFAQKTLRLEYGSVLMCQKFQDDVWRKFCKANDIECGEDDWYFPKGTTFVGWYEMLRSSEEGRAYLRVYQGEED